MFGGKKLDLRPAAHSYSNKLERNPKVLKLWYAYHQWYPGKIDIFTFIFLDE